MESARRLLTPLSYLRIERQGKVFDELVCPLVFLSLTFMVFWIVSWEVTVFGSNGLVSAIGGYLQVVSGFYIASLAAVATFNQKSMDEPMAGESPILSVRRKGRIKDEKLTRRRFLCFLFGYLSFLSISMLFCGIGANLIAEPLSVFFVDVAGFYIKWFFAAIYIFAGYNLLCTTLLGLYYMTDRIHREEASFIEDADSIKKDSNHSAVEKRDEEDF